MKLVSDRPDVAEYTYDTFSRRVEKVDKTGETDVTTRFVLDGGSVTEICDDDGARATFAAAPTRRAKAACHGPR